VSLGIAGEFDGVDRARKSIRVAADEQGLRIVVLERDAAVALRHPGHATERMDGVVGVERRGDRERSLDPRHDRQAQQRGGGETESQPPPFLIPTIPVPPTNVFHAHHFSARQSW